MRLYIQVSSHFPPPPQNPPHTHTQTHSYSQLLYIYLCVCVCVCVCVFEWMGVSFHIVNLIIPIAKIAAIGSLLLINGEPATISQTVAPTDQTSTTCQERESSCK